MMPLAPANMAFFTWWDSTSVEIKKKNNMLSITWLACEAKTGLSYLITSEYFPVSDNDDFPCDVDAHVSLQLEEVLGATVVHVHQLPLGEKTGNVYKAS